MASDYDDGSGGCAICGEDLGECACPPHRDYEGEGEAEFDQLLDIQDYVRVLMGFPDTDDYWSKFFHD